MNRLAHGASYSNVLEIEATIANSKLSSSTTLIPNDIYQHIPTTAVYDNIDRLEETLSGCGTTLLLNGVLVQQAFIGPPLPPVISCMEKTKNNGALKFLNVYYQLTMQVENRKFLFFHALIKNYQQKPFRYN